MDRDQETTRDTELDRLMQQASASVQEALDAAIDVQQRLRDLLREAGVETVPAHRRHL